MGPIRGKTRSVVAPKDTKANVDMSIHNRFDIEVIDGSTGEVKQKAQAENIICNQLWTRLMTPATYFSHIGFGTGTGTPSAANTHLFTHLGSKSAISGVYTYDWANGVISLRKQCQILESEYVGSALTEVGIEFDSGTSSLCTHAMLKDMNGNQISIAKTATDIINIYATVFVHWNVAGYDNGTRKIKVFGNVSNIFLTQFLMGIESTSAVPKRITYNTGWECPTGYMGGGIPYNSPAGPSGHSADATVVYSAASKTITITAARLAADKGIMKGIKKAILSTYYSNGGPNSYPILACESGGEWYSGTNITGEAIATGDGVTKKFSTDFEYKSGGKIYVNGVEQSTGVTFSANPTIRDHYSEAFELVDGGVVGMLYPACYQDDNWNGKTSQDNNSVIYYNPNYAYGVNTISAYNMKLEMSDDNVNWTLIGTSTSSLNVTVPEACRYFKYWRCTSRGSSSAISNYVPYVAFPTTNIEFDVAPASGAVITADYTSSLIAKDTNHVFDLTVTIQLGEHTT